MQNPFHNPAFSMANLTAAINQIPNRYGKLEALRLMPEKSVRFRQVLEEDLDGHVAAQARVLRAIDFAHAAGAEHRDDFIGSQAGACGESHHVLRELGGWCRGRPAAIET